MQQVVGTKNGSLIFLSDVVHYKFLDVSQILKNESIEFDYKLAEWLPKEDGTGKWIICWRATEDGWNASVFHSNCDGKKPTLTIVEVLKNSKKYVFGGYATETWDDPGGDDFFGEFKICTFYKPLILVTKFIMLPHINTEIDTHGCEVI